MATTALIVEMIIIGVFAFGLISLLLFRLAGEVFEPTTTLVGGS